MIDILLATYNGEKYLPELLDSIFSQTYTDWKIIVSDDGSADCTLEIIESYKNKHPQKIELVTHVPMHSAKLNFFSLLEHSTSDFVMFCDQDDIWKKQKIETLLNACGQADQNKPFLVFSDMEVVNEANTVRASSFLKSSHLSSSKILFNNLLSLNCIAGCSMMFNAHLRDVVLQAETKYYSSALMHDSWCALVAAAFGSIIYVDEPLVSYRQHETNTVGDKPYFDAVKEGLLDQGQRKKTLLKNFEQAAAFNQAYRAKLSPKQLEILRAYSDLHYSSILQKVFLLTKYGFWKYGLARKIDQLINS